MEDSRKSALRVSRLSILINMLLSVVKLAAGLVAHSGAMVSDAAHSFSDVLSTVVVIIGMRAAGKESDREHPYGHERMECVAALVLAMALAVTGLLIGWQGLKTIFLSDHASLPVPGALALAAAVISILVKEGMYHYTRAAAKQAHSDALMADAWHHRSDALSSIGSLIGIAGARLGAPVLDPIASLVICLMIIHAAYGIFRDAVGKMVDQSCDSQTEAEIRKVALANPAVRRVDLLMTRRFGSRIYVEMEVSMDGGMSLKDSHAAAERVHAAVEAALPDVKHIMIHVNPVESPEDQPAQNSNI